MHIATMQWAWLKSHLKLTLFVVALILSLSLPHSVHAATMSASTLISLTNQQRQAAGLQPFQPNAQLNLSAQLKANDMIRVGYWSHVSPTGVQPWYFMGAAGYSYISAGENLARNYTVASDVMAGWMASPTHRANVLGDYHDIGMAVVDGVMDGHPTQVVVAHYGKQVAARPAPAPAPAPTPARTATKPSSNVKGSASNPTTLPVATVTSPIAVAAAQEEMPAWHHALKELKDNLIKTINSAKNYTLRFNI